ncbi:hypothetical protein [Flavobacterium sp. NRK F7]|uniref:hypothetical protein n=1 Tax=Flavobacterium sp. NRK F7 TaxID=2954930 RepID=UPI0020903524|nr:hypothetical protein [Flavobacterium sp. NRK F7]MCO6163689.1 hypothetical protein [Flavobacterium sp. NRK F7]
MKEVFIAYFDFLGFKEFILNNIDENELMRRMGHIFRDIEFSLGQGEMQEPRNGVILADLSNSKINCLNISDTVVFWTNDTTIESLKELVKVAYEFNWRENLYNFPVRGSISKGSIRIVNGININDLGVTYGVSCLYGKGIVNAHIKTESQEWAGTVIDNSMINEFTNEDEAFSFLEKFAVKYMVPYKNGIIQEKEEFALRLTKSKLNEIAYTNTKENIERVFSQDHKSTTHPNVQLKIKNTIDFLSTFKE